MPMAKERQFGSTLCVRLRPGYREVLEGVARAKGTSVGVVIRDILEAALHGEQSETLRG